MVPEDRKLQGLVVGHPISENIVYANLDKVGTAAGSRNPLRPPSPMGPSRSSA